MTSAGVVHDEDTEWGRIVHTTQEEEESGSCSSNADILQAIEEQVDIAVVGGGLAGLAVAIGLTNSKSALKVKVYERAPELRSVSQGILCIQHNGLDALEEIHPELPALVRSVGCERHQLVLTTIKANGSQEEKVVDTGAKDMAKFGRIKVGLTWHRMQQVLASLLPPETVVTGHSLSSFVEDSSGVVLGFDSGVRVRAKLVLACDGVFSMARKKICNKIDRPISFGQLNWGTVIDTNQLPPNVHPPNAVHFFSYEGKPRWMSMLNDGGKGQTFWQFRVADPEQALSLSKRKGRGGLGLPGVKEALRPAAQHSKEVWSAIECIPEQQIFERSIVGRVPATTWLSKGGRVALVGDSAHGMHPNIGQGANSAFESAAVVIQTVVEAAASISDGNDDDEWKVALKTYEEKRKPRADIVQRFANIMGCRQSIGDSFLPQEVVTKMLEWVVDNDPKNHPSQQTVDLLQSFDPLAQAGVTKL